MKQAYIKHRPQAKTRTLIATVNAILAEYGTDYGALSLRQLFYQLVSRGEIKNTENSYQNISDHVGNARLGGVIDWDSIQDRGRSLEENPHWAGPADAIDDISRSYGEDKWLNQPYRVECWCEKDALAGVLGGICRELDVPLLPTKGYNSLTMLREAGGRMMAHRKSGAEPIVLYVGDHDPSGINMTEVVRTRLEMFAERPILVERVALNIDQVHQFNLPPNPAKEKDTRAKEYVARFGPHCWELDALPPKYLVELVRDAILQRLDVKLWKEALEAERQNRQRLRHLGGQLQRQAGGAAT